MIQKLMALPRKGMSGNPVKGYTWMPDELLATGRSSFEIGPRRPSESIRHYRLRCRLLRRDVKRVRRRARQIAAIHRVSIDKRLVQRLSYGRVTIYADGRVVRTASMIEKMVQRIHEASLEVRVI